MCDFFNESLNDHKTLVDDRWTRQISGQTDGWVDRKLNKQTEIML